MESETKAYTIDEVTDRYSDDLMVALRPEDQPTTYEDYDDFQVFIFRRLRMEDEALGTTCEAFLLRQNEVCFYDRDSRLFRQLPGAYEALADSIEAYHTQNQRILTAYSAEIERLEEALFTRKIPAYFMDLWFDIKKDVARIENYYYRNSLVFKEFARRQRSRFGEYADWFKDLEDDIVFQQGSLANLKSKLDSLHHYHDSIKSERLNRTMFTLTLMSGVFLPLNLIVGFFGMNTRGLFFSDDPAGTHLVTILLASTLFISLFGLPIIKLIDRWVLRLLLGRYNVYKSIMKRVKKVDSRFRDE
ncbi:MAG: CorA family divalent cation transporter [Leptospiraceae bacterium]